MRTARGRVRRLAHGPDRDPRARRGGVAAAPAVQRRPAAARGRRPVQRDLPRGRRRARRPVHLPAGRVPLPDGHQRRQPRARPGVVSGPRQASSTSTWSTGATTSRCSPSRVPQARAAAAGPRRRRAAAAHALLPAHGAPESRCSSAAPATPGEDGVELLLDPASAATVWDALLAAGATPAGLGARDTLRLEVCFHLYGNDLSEERGPIEAGLGWCCKEADRLHRLRARRPDARRRARRAAGGVRDRGLGIARQGNPIAGGGVVTSGTFSPCLKRGIGMAYVPSERAEPGTALEIDVRGTTRTRRGRHPSPSTKRRPDRQCPTPAIPTICSTTPSTTGPGSIRSDEATFGITWYAQDSLGEVVFFDPPEVGTPGQQGLRLHRGRVGQGGLGRDLAAVGRDRSRSTTRWPTSPRRSTRTPTARAGWSRSSCPTPPSRSRCSTPRPTRRRCM